MWSLFVIRLPSRNNDTVWICVILWMARIYEISTNPLSVLHSDLGNNMKQEHQHRILE